MLVLARREGEEIQIGPHVRLVVTEIRADSVRIGIEAPPDVQIWRTELLAAIAGARGTEHEAAER